MGKTKIVMALLIVITLTFSSMLLVESTSALSTTPAVPEFTVKLVDNSYDIPPEYEINQFTGENVTVKFGQHVQNISVEFTIKNPPHTTTGLYYNFRFKGPYGEAWSYYPFYPSGRSVIPYNGQSWGTGNLTPKLAASKSAYTTISLPLGKVTSAASGFSGTANNPAGGQIEFQAQALSGNIDIDVSGLLAGSYYDFTGQSSGWSDTQTLSLSENSNPTNESTPTPTVPEISTILLLPLLATMSLIITAVLRKKRL